VQNLQMFGSRSGVHSTKAGVESESKITPPGYVNAATPVICVDNILMNLAFKLARHKSNKLV